MNQAEETLDPKDWNDVHQIGHRMLDDVIDHLKNIRNKKVWQPLPPSVHQFYKTPLNEEPIDLRTLYDQFKEFVLPFAKGSVHPRFWGWVEGSGSIAGVFADMLASAMNSNSPFGDLASTHMEKQVIQWMIRLFGFPAGASGLLTTGGSLANITALTVARNHHFNFVRKEGMRSGLVVYASSSTHSSIEKAVELIGVGTANYRKVPVDNNFEIQIQTLQGMIDEDRERGLQPFCIVGNAGTVDTGAIDDLASLAKIARAEKMWFHVDGAFGAVPKLLPEFSEKLAGLELADSLAFDFHKWFYVNYDVGCFLVRDRNIHEDAFRYHANYLFNHDRGIMSSTHDPHQLGLELSRSFRSLKVWMMLRENGVAKYRRMVRQNLAQAQHLKTLVEKKSCLELLAPVSMNIVCFRYINPEMDLDRLNHVNKEILMTMHVDGTFAPSYTLIHGKYAIRVAITNHRSRKDDFEALVNEVVKQGNDLTSSNPIRSI